MAAQQAPVRNGVASVSVLAPQLHVGRCLGHRLAGAGRHRRLALAQRLGLQALWLLRRAAVG